MRAPSPAPAPAPQGFDLYLTRYLWVARNRPEVLRAKTEKRRAAVIAEHCTAAEYDERARAFATMVLRRYPEDVLKAGAYADDLLAGYAAKVAEARYCERKPRKSAVDRFEGRVQARVAKAQKRAA